MFKITNKYHVKMISMYKNQCWQAWVISNKRSLFTVVWPVYVCACLLWHGSFVIFISKIVRYLQHFRKIQFPLTIILMSMVHPIRYQVIVCDNKYAWLVQQFIIAVNETFVIDFVWSVHVTWTLPRITQTCTVKIVHK